MSTRELEFFVVPYNSKKIGRRHLVSNKLGGWAFLEHKDFAALSSLDCEPGSELFERLRGAGVVADVTNIGSLLSGYRKMNQNLFSDTSLHIAVVTTRCNLACQYCQARPESGEDMSPEVASRVLKYLFDVRNPSVMLEFQGGEPLMNWPVVSLLTEHARKFNTSGKQLQIAMVSNLLLLTEEQIKFLVEHEVNLCTSLDGPEDLHDQNRKDWAGKGTYKDLMCKVDLVRKKFNWPVYMLPTITKASLKHARRIVDEYVRQGQLDICLRPVNDMGAARCSWKSLGYTPEEFLAFYREACEYIFELNRKGIAVRERMARVLMTKVLFKEDPRYVDVMNPCGAGRVVMTYMPDGGCFPCDEARMVGGDLFKLGNILKDDYKDVICSENLLNLLQSSCSDLWQSASVYSPWTGYCPVVNYATQQNVITKSACSQAQKILEGQFDYLFEKLEQGGENEIFLREWAKGIAHEKK